MIFPSSSDSVEFLSYQQTTIHPHGRESIYVLLIKTDRVEDAMEKERHQKVLKIFNYSFIQLRIFFPQNTNVCFRSLFIVFQINLPILLQDLCSKYNTEYPSRLSLHHHVPRLSIWIVLREIPVDICTRGDLFQLERSFSMSSNNGMLLTASTRI